MTHEMIQPTYEKVLHSSEAVLSDEELLQAVANAFVLAYSRPPWEEEHNADSVVSSYREDLKSGDGVTPILSVFKNGDLVLAYTSGLVVNSDRTNAISKVLLRSEYYGKVAKNPIGELNKFWEKISLNPRESCVFVYDTIKRGDENSFDWVVTADGFSQKAIELGASRMVGFTLRGSGIYEPLKKMNAITIEQIVEVRDGVTGPDRLLVYCADFPFIANKFKRPAERVLRQRNG